MERFGEPVGDGAAVFRCGECGAVAGVVRIVPAGEPVELGRPPLPLTPRSDGVVVEGFRGAGWHTAGGGEAYREIGRLLAEERPDPVALRRFNRELAPFYCPDCGRSYCAAHWALRVVVDEGFYEFTEGVCPAGHRHEVDD